MIGNTNSDADKIALRNGGRNDPNAGTWGTITPANGYTQEVVVNHNIGGSDGGLIIAPKEGQTSIQVDGWFKQTYVNSRCATSNWDAGIDLTKQDSGINYGDNSWYWCNDYPCIVVVKSRNRQNLVAQLTWGSDTASFFTIAEHWDNNNGDGIATLTFCVPRYHAFRIYTNSNRDTDGADRLSFFRIIQQ